VSQTKHRLFNASDLAPGGIRRVEIDGVAIAIVRDHLDRYFALRDVCPHQGAALSEGYLEKFVASSGSGDYALAQDRDILRCGWHGYEFHLDTGRCPADPARVRIRTYAVSVEDGLVVVER
jgi:nitrite reductase (NADH) small subunit